jgi:hypothetical protein
MRWSLRHDEPSDELRLMASDLWAGVHERTEWRVLGNDGKPLRRRPDLDGRRVIYNLSAGHPSQMFSLAPEQAIAWDSRPVYIQNEPSNVLAEKIPCPRAQNSRRKCLHCLALEAAK